MSYMDQASDPRRRAATIIAVGGIHALLAVGVVAGLAVNGGIKLQGETTTIFDVPVDIPPPPAPTPEASAQPRDDTPVVRPSPELVLTPLPPIPSDPMPLDPAYGNPTAGSNDTGPISIPTPPPPPMPSPTATFSPVRAKAINSPAGWISTDDYPANELRRGIEGTSHYRLVIGSNGRVNACEITTTSGNARLDATTCSLITRRARFDAAMDNSGARTVGTYSGSVKWEIPKD
ncbi:TonB family protein [Altererythrobacter xixiisoli]|uniref:TonB family protein n=1 Tax=Croceibacterium xixiisoli TaxID=1476466 RepID=A0A6I4TTY9_9SPHN|nr:TonB family protein [Croceibacterium xixiisoli]MXO99374.1 TonB family protein [Croceibacterium xixiisoli]